MSKDQRRGQPGPVLGTLLLLSSLLVAPRALAQNPPGTVAIVFGEFLVLVVSESEQDDDLSGDGDKTDQVIHVHNVWTGDTTNLELAVSSFRGFRGVARAFGDWLAFIASERDQGEDLNGDGDTEDEVVHVHDFVSGETENLELAYYSFSVYGILGEGIVLEVLESRQGEDLNGDGDQRDKVVHIHDAFAAETTNLGLANAQLYISGDWLVLGVSEKPGEDLNGDGDSEDRVVLLHNLFTGETTNPGLAVFSFRIRDSWLLLRVSEPHQGEDLNGDGDTKDQVVHTHDLLTGGETTNLRLASTQFDLFRDWLTLQVFESRQGKDLNGDGDAEDRVDQVHNLATGETVNPGLAGGAFFVVEDWLPLWVSESQEGRDLNDDGDTGDHVVHLYNVSSGEATNLRLAGAPLTFIAGDQLQLLVRVSESQQGEDLNGDGDTDDDVDRLIDLDRLDEFEPRFVRGEANADGDLDLGDGIFILSFLFRGGEAPTCLDAADADDSGAINLSDAVSVFGFLFAGGPPPAAPGVSCGNDETDDRLGCRSFKPCVADG